MPEREYIITDAIIDNYVAGLVSAAGTETRGALNQILPKGLESVSVPSSIVTSVVQNADGTWPTPVRVGDGVRLFHGAPGKPYPTWRDGLRPNDMYLSTGVIRRCLTADGVTPPSWLEIYNVNTTTPGDVVTTDPGETAPTPPDTPPPGTITPQMTVRPMTLLGSTGVWSSTGSTSLIEALSDQHLTGVTAAPSSAGGGVSIRVEVAPLLMASGNDLLVTLWGLKAPTSGAVTVRLTRNGAALAAPITQPVTTTATSPEYRWPSTDLPILSSWDRVVVEITRDAGGIDLVDVTAQSVPPVTVQPPTGGTASSSSIFGGVFASDLRTSPTSIYTTDKRKHLTAAGPIILGCYDDAPMVVVATATTQRVKITTPVAGGNKTDGSGWADSVPIPSSTKTPTNRWRVLIVLSPTTDEYWEFVEVSKNATTGAWSCTRGGKITKMSTSKGVMPTGTGITGSGLALGATRVTLDEARKAKQGDVAAIAHAIGLNLPGNFYAATYFAAPATRTDGKLSAATEEAARKTVPLTGDRVRLRKDFNTSTLTGLPKAIAEALKTFGAVITGGSAKPSLICESGETEQAASGIEPWGELLAGQSVDTILSWLKASDLEFVPAGWLSEASPVSESPMSTTPVVTPTNPTSPTPTAPTTARIKINMPSGVRWMSGASCKAIENSSEGMGSPFAQWRGEPAYFARTWWDRPGADANNCLRARYENWHAPIDCGPGFFYEGENMSAAASGAYEGRWRTHLQQTRAWWEARRDPQRMQVFMSPAHEMNGNWYPWSVTPGNYKQFIDAWKRYRAIQLQVFPEAILTFNVNRGSSGSHIDWRNYVPGYSYGGGKVSDWIDCGSVDYYNFWPAAKTQSDWDAHILEYDQWGGPKGLERHRQFWEQQGLALTIPEWGFCATWGDNPIFADGMNNYFRKHAGTGAGQVVAEAYFNLSAGYTERFAIYGDDVGSPNAAARYRALTWGN